MYTIYLLCTNHSSSLYLASGTTDIIRQFWKHYTIIYYILYTFNPHSKPLA
jgi:hypothetical protein